MKSFLLSLCFAFTGYATLHAQQTDAVKQSIQTFFEGFGRGDTALMMTVTDRRAMLQTVYDQKTPTLLHYDELQALLNTLARPRSKKWEERITAYDIRIDGKFASAWCHYTFFVDDVPSHCGTDNFQLYQSGNKWIIFSIADTRRDVKDCVSNTATETAGESKQIDSLLNQWHKAAATADEKIFFDLMGNNSIYLGTDKTENWTKKVFEEWSKKYFDRDKAWDFKPYNRHIYFSPDMQVAWFDELLETWMGICRGSGVWLNENGVWKMQHYNLAVTLPNEKTDAFIKLMKK